MHLGYGFIYGIFIFHNSESRRCIPNCNFFTVGAFGALFFNRRLYAVHVSNE
jgi:hypothetical protein